MTCIPLYCDQQLQSNAYQNCYLQTITVFVRRESISFLSSSDCSLMSSAGAISVLTGLANNPDGLKYIALSQCGLTGKTVTYLATMLNDNPCHLSTLSHLDLSHNNLKDDVHVSYIFFFRSLLDYSSLRLNLTFFFSEFI